MKSEDAQRELVPRDEARTGTDGTDGRPPPRLYALIVRAIWLKVGEGATSQTLVHGDGRLLNPYEVILVNPAKHQHVNVTAANAFIDWLVSAEGRIAIGEYRLKGEQIFTPVLGRQADAMQSASPRPRDCHSLQIVENL